MFDTYSFAQAISRINVGYRSHQVFVVVPNTKLVFQTLSLLKRNGLINSFSLNFDNKEFKVFLNHSSIFSKQFPTLNLISKPSIRHYLKYQTYLHDFYGTPFMIISTKHGLITNHELAQARIGGELLLIFGPQPNFRGI